MVHFLVHEVILWYMRWDIESLEKRIYFMPKLVKNLSALEIKRLKDSGTYAVGHVAGLQLIISDNGTRQWVYRTMAGLGHLPMQ